MARPGGGREGGDEEGKAGDEKRIGPPVCACRKIAAIGATRSMGYVPGIERRCDGCNGATPVSLHLPVLASGRNARVPGAVVAVGVGVGVPGVTVIVGVGDTQGVQVGGGVSVTWGT